MNASLVQGSVEHLPYPDESFDSIVNTMAFSGYPDGVAALSEMRRVLRSGGRLVLIDVGYPSNGNWLGTKLAEFWKWSGDILRATRSSCSSSSRSITRTKRSVAGGASTCS